MKRKTGFSLVEMLIVISIISLLVGILLPALAGARQSAKRAENNTKVRAIQQSMFEYAQGNNQKYPGLGLDGEQTTTVERYQLLVDGNYLAPVDFVAPEDSVSVATSSTLDSSHVSYAALQIDDVSADSGRRIEWATTANSEAAVISDRDLGDQGGNEPYSSIWSDDYWKGSVAFNDGHVTFFSSATLLGQNDQARGTQYGNTPCNTDNLFKTNDTGCSANANAMMILTE